MSIVNQHECILHRTVQTYINSDSTL